MAKSIPFRTAYGSYNPKDYAYSDDNPSLTMQSFQKECDINEVMRKWEKTGQFPTLEKPSSRYEDISELGDYQSALNTVIAGQNAFDSLDANVRYRFSNDPANFVNFCQDPANADELVALGLAERPVLSESQLKMNNSSSFEEPSKKTASESILDNNLK